MSSVLTVLPASRKEAIATGAKHYFTGKACKRGHVAPRHFDGHCTECEIQYRQCPEVKKRALIWQSNYDREYRQCPEVNERERQYSRDYLKRPGVKEHIASRYKLSEVRKSDRERMQRRNAAKRNATPPWLTSKHIEEMRSFYAEAIRLTDETGVVHQVDHIVPLTHSHVQGLHVPWNLQVLTEAENKSKHNAFDGTHKNESWRQK